jgi:mevalonate kinase
MTKNNTTNLTQVTASAPGKLMLSVGYAVVHGHPTIVTAVDQRLYATVVKNGVDVFHLDAPDLGLTSYTKTISELGTKDLPKAVRFIEILYKNFLEKHPQKEGIIVTTKSDFSSSYGFGSSSAVTVAFAKALTALYDVKLSNKELFELCYQAVLDVQGVGSGFDLASAIWGGTLYFISPARVVKSIDSGNLPVVIAYSGVKADTPTLIRMVNNMLDEDPDRINKVFDGIGKIADDFVDIFENGVGVGDEGWQKVGNLFDQSQQFAKDLKVSNNKLEKLILAAKNAGAYGATSSGAAGGDCILAVVGQDGRADVESALKQAGGKIIDVNLNATGVRIEKN